MKENNIRILSTRPLAHTTMLDAEELEVKMDIASFIETRTIIDKISGNRILQLAHQEIAVVFTSMNAAEAVIDCLKAINAEPAWTIYTLGGVTNTILENYFTGSEIFSAAINGVQLARNIIENEEEEVVFFCGNRRRDELPMLLQQQQIKLEEVVVYETIETPVKIETKYDGILFFSPSAVQSFFKINSVAEKTILFAIGSTTAEAIKQMSNNKVLVGKHPHKENLAKLAMNYLLNAGNINS